MMPVQVSLLGALSPILVSTIIPARGAGSPRLCQAVGISDGDQQTSQQEDCCLYGLLVDQNLHDITVFLDTNQPTNRRFMFFSGSTLLNAIIVSLMI